MVTRWEVTNAVRASDLPAPARLVMHTLLVVAEVGTAEIPPQRTPSLGQLAKETGLTKSTVAKHLNALEADGWVARIRPETAEALGRGERTKYRLGIPSAADEPSDPNLVQETDSPSAGDERPSAADGHRDRSSSDEKQIENKPSTSVAASARKRGTRLPDDFKVTEDMLAWARENVPQLAGRRETEKFTNYWRAKTGASATKLDWVATWKNWMLTAADRLPGTVVAVRNGHKPSTTDERVRAAQALKEQIRARERSPT